MWMSHCHRFCESTAYRVGKQKGDEREADVQRAMTWRNEILIIYNSGRVAEAQGMEGRDEDIEVRSWRSDGPTCCQQ